METRSMGLRSALALLLLAGGSAPRAAGPGLTLEQVVAEHIEAHGGAPGWEAIRSLEITGSMNAWSQEGPFTLRRTRDGRYRLDSVQGGRKVVAAYDGETAWWDNHWYQQGALRIRGADLAAFIRELDFPTPFFDYGKKGHEVRLIGAARFDDREAIALEVRRADGLAETWYLDPSTRLEFARESPGSDYGIPVPMVTFYSDFRSVAGVVMPYRIESQWGSRERTLTVGRIEANVAVEDALFIMPRSTEMDPLAPLAGRWSVEASQRLHPGAPWRDSRRLSTIERLLDGAPRQERTTTTLGHDVVRSITWDRLKQVYRVTEISEATGRLNVQEGRLDPDIRLVVSNKETGTRTTGAGHDVIDRLTISEITPGRFVTEKEFSTDGGVEWFLAAKAVYTRDGQAEPVR